MPLRELGYAIRSSGPQPQVGGVAAGWRGAGAGGVIMEEGDEKNWGGS